MALFGVLAKSRVLGGQTLKWGYPKIRPLQTAIFGVYTLLGRVRVFVEDPQKTGC